MESDLQVACSWSGGKDSCFALMKAVEAGAVPRVLLNVMNENGRVSRSHALPLAILQQQADSMNVALTAVPASWSDYEKTFIHTLKEVKSSFNIEAVVFGDIELQAHRDWEEMVCSKAGLTALLPLWKKNTREVVADVLQNNIQTIIVSCNPALGEKYLGRQLDHEVIEDLDAMGVDVCGENGEFHTLVTNCPLFKQPVVLPPASKVWNDGYWFLQWHM